MIKNQLAAFTIAQNEDHFLNIWISHYSKHLPNKDLYILDHNSTIPASIEALDRARASGINVIPVHRFHSFDHLWLRDVVCEFQAFLLQSYSVVIFAEADELIMPKPDSYKDGLRSFVLDRLKEEPSVLRCKGYTVEHVPSEEAPIDFTKPLLQQRSYWRATTLYDKPVVSNRPCKWTIGFHNLSHVELPVEKDLLLVHLHRLDYDYCKKAHRERASRNWSKFDIDNSYGRQNRVYDGDEFDAWFFEGLVKNMNNQLRGGPREKIPHYMKDAF